MQKLHTKIFGVLFGVLSFCLLVFIIVFNVQSYNEQQNFIENHLKNTSFSAQNPAEPKSEQIQLPDQPSTQISPETPSIDYAQELISRARQITTTTIIFSVFLFIALESVIFFVARALANWALKPVQATLEKQKRFIADTSHELKTPLSVIIASAEALEKAPDETKWLTNIKSESARMNLLITELLELASSEHTENLPLKTKNLSKIVELAALTFEGKAFEKDIKLKTAITPDLKIPLNENAIKQLVEILLDNAIDHADKSTTITLSLKPTQKHIELAVKNHGHPIPKGEEEKIFERFYRTDKSRNRQNNHYGLGLAIAKNLVTSHHGEISASSRNTTTTFKVTFKK